MFCVPRLLRLIGLPAGHFRCTEMILHIDSMLSLGRFRLVGVLVPTGHLPAQTERDSKSHTRHTHQDPYIRSLTEC